MPILEHKFNFGTNDPLETLTLVTEFYENDDEEINTTQTIVFNSFNTGEVILRLDGVFLDPDTLRDLANELEQGMQRATDIANS